MQKTIKLTENQLRTIVKEAVHNIISDLGDKDIDIEAVTKTIFPDHEPPKKFMPKKSKNTNNGVAK